MMFEAVTDIDKENETRERKRGREIGREFWPNQPLSITFISRRT